MTPKQKMALEIIRDNPGIYPREFAKKMWPDSDGHDRHHNCGPKGVTRGGMMNMAGGGYIGRLVKAGLVIRHYGKHQNGVYLTKEGVEALEEAKDGV